MLFKQAIFVACAVWVGVEIWADSRFDADASVVYWKTQVNGLSYALEADAATPLIPQGKVVNPAFRWGPGFCVGLGYRMPHDGWKVALQGTLYKSHCTTDFIPASNRVLLPVWASAAAFQQANQHYRLHLGLVDLLLGKSLCVSSRMEIHPYMGISFGSVRQKYHLYYSKPVPPAEDTVIWRMKNKFWGVGPIVGCSGSVCVYKGISVFAKSSLSLLYGEYYLHQGQEKENPHIRSMKVFDEFALIAPIAFGTMGLRWQSCPHKRWSVELGYDQMLLFAQNQLLHFKNSSTPGQTISNQGDLSLLGTHCTVSCVF